MTEVPTPPQQPMLSPDGRWRWDGAQWVAYQPVPPPQAYPSPPPVSRQAPAGTAWAPPAAPQQAVQAWAAPPRGMAPGVGGRGLAYQFSGNAMWSIILGVVSVVVPLVSSFYFPILPLFGLWRGVLAIQRGRVAGGVIGLILNVLGALSSLLASGLLFH